MTFSESIQDAFKKKKRDGGDPYFKHLERVQKSARSSVEKYAQDEDQSYFHRLATGLEANSELILKLVDAIALAHDYIEDIGSVADLFHLVTDSELADLGPKNVAFIMESVKALSRGKDENYFDFINRISKAHLLVKVVKLADLYDNMSDSPEGSRKDKYRFAFEKISANYWN